MINEVVLRFEAVCERLDSLLDKVEGLGNKEKCEILLSLWECMAATQQESLQHLKVIVALKEKLKDEG